MSEFRAGFAARHDATAAALTAAFGLPLGFESIDLTSRGTVRPRAFTSQGEGGPRHFTPQDPDANPTEGWDPLDPDASQPEGAGFVDPIAAAHAAGYSEGMAAALTKQAADAGRDRDLLETLGEALSKGVGFDRERLARQLRQTVTMLVTRLVGDAGVSPELLAQRIERATDCLADSAESAILRLHPEDLALVQGLLPKTVFAAGDLAVSRGSFILESASTIVEDGPQQWLDQLTAAIDRVAVPNAG